MGERRGGGGGGKGENLEFEKFCPGLWEIFKA